MEAGGVVAGRRGERILMSWEPRLVQRKNGGPLGLRNLGNSCYLNSVLQCLTYTPPLANFCLNFSHSSLCDSATDPDKKRVCPFCLLEKRIARSLSIELTLESPAKIHSCLRIFSENFKCGRQEDAHEFLRYVIDACHNTCLRLKKLQQQRAKKSSNGTGGQSSSSDTIVKDIFGGALQSQVKCLSCGNESNKIDEIMDICLEISGCSSLKEAMRRFFQAETLDGNNKYKCERCKKLVTAKKQMSIRQAPNVLAIQLKRFEGIFGGKIDRVIAFEEILVLSSFMCKASKDPHPEYSLFATIVHSGFSPESGHYYAYIKDAVGRWYCCNDSYVTLSTLQEVLSEKAYILFFTRTSQRPVSADIATLSNGVKSHAMATVSNGVKSHVIATASNGVKCHANGAVSNGAKSLVIATASNGVKCHANGAVSNGAKSQAITAVSNGVKSHASNGNIECRSPKSTTPAKATIKSSNGPSFGKVTGVVSKPDDASEVLQNKFNGFAFAKKHSPSDNGKVETQKKESAECNGNNSSVGKQMNGYSTFSLAHQNRNYTNGKRASIGSSQDLVNGNGHIQNGYRGGKEDIHKDSSLNDKEIVGKMPVNGVSDNGLSNGHVGICGIKRKLENRDSSILLAKDTLSRTQVERFKEVLQKEALSVLQSCGWSDKLYKYMKSRKRLCMDTCTSTDSNEQKKALIFDAKPSFISQIPGSLKGSLIERIRSFSRGK